LLAKLNDAGAEAFRSAVQSLRLPAVSLHEADRRQRQREESHRTSERILSFRDWCALNGFSASTGRRIIAAGKVRVTQLSERRIGISESANADYQAACVRGGA
jgi:hypothetical protein